MRRLYVLLMALGLVGGMIGCHHICGICDCQGNGYSGLCGCGYGGVVHGDPAAPPVQPGEGMHPLPQGPVGGAPTTLPAPSPMTPGSLQ